MGRFVERRDDMLGAADRNIACGASARRRHGRKSARRVSCTNQKLSTLLGGQVSAHEPPFAARAIAAAHAPIRPFGRESRPRRTRRMEPAPCGQTYANTSKMVQSKASMSANFCRKTSGFWIFLIAAR